MGSKSGVLLHCLTNCLRSNTISHIDACSAQKACGFVQSTLVLQSSLLCYLSRVELLAYLGGVASRLSVGVATARSSHFDVFLVVVIIPVPLRLLPSNRHNLWLLDILTLPCEEVFGKRLIFLKDGVGIHCRSLARLVITLCPLNILHGNILLVGVDGPLRILLILFLHLFLIFMKKV